jgi:hypothetical protein
MFFSAIKMKKSFKKYPILKLKNIYIQLKMFQANKFKFIFLFSLTALLHVHAQTNYCWDPSTGAQVTCTSPINVYCVTNYTSGVGSCSDTQPTDPSFLYCNSGDGCNKIVTKCYNPASRVKSRKSKNSNSNENSQDNNLSGYVACDDTGLDQYCQVNKKDA